LNIFIDDFFLIVDSAVYVSAVLHISWVADFVYTKTKNLTVCLPCLIIRTVFIDCISIVDIYCLYTVDSVVLVELLSCVSS